MMIFKEIVERLLLESTVGKEYWIAPNGKVYDVEKSGSHINFIHDNPHLFPFLKEILPRLDPYEEYTEEYDAWLVYALKTSMAKGWIRVEMLPPGRPGSNYIQVNGKNPKKWANKLFDLGSEWINKDTYISVNGSLGQASAIRFMSWISRG